jgi:uncharacterized RDD family membrane protein YckC
MDSGGIILRRWAGAWIDFVALAALFLALGLSLRAVSINLALAAALVGVLAYFPVTEGLWGRSAGKFITGTIVVDRAGDRPGIGKAVIRTLFRLFEVNPFLVGGLPAGLAAWFTAEHQRLGDLVADTYVVPLRDLQKAQAEASLGAL